MSEEDRIYSISFFGTKDRLFFKSQKFTLYCTSCVQIVCTYKRKRLTIPRKSLIFKWALTDSNRRPSACKEPN